MPRQPRAASLPTVRKAGGELTDDARMAIVVDYEAFSQGVRTKFSSVKALALAHKVNPDVRAAQRLAALMGKTVAEQANAGFSEVWRRADLLSAIQSDDQLMNFTDLMAMVVTSSSNAKMQTY